MPKPLLAIVLLAFALSLAALPVAVPDAARAQSAKPAKLSGQKSIRNAVNEGTVTVMTDGVTERSGLVTQLAGELAETVDQDGRLRLLPVMGYGATTSVRDLLYLRGIDLGILNADVLTYLELEGKLPEAKRRLRYVTRLLDKTVFIAATNDITSLEQLRDRKVVVIGKDSDSHVTARTILGLAGIEASLVFADWDQAAALLASGDVQALVALDRSAVALERRLGKDVGLKLLPITLSPALASVYQTRLISGDEAPGLVPPEGITTLTVPTVLAVFGWRKTHARFVVVNGFIDALFGAIGRLQERDANGLWSRIDPRADVAGWQRYEPAVPLIARLPAAVAVTQSASAPTADLFDPDSTAWPATTATIVSPPAIAAPAASTVTIAVAAAPALPTVKAEPPSPVALPARITILATPQAGLMEAGTNAKGLLADVLRKRLQAGRPGDAVTADELTAQSDTAANLERLKTDRGIDTVLVAGAPKCESATDAPLCRDFLFTAPIFQVINGFFGKPGGPEFSADDAAVGRAICAPASADVSGLDGGGRNWVKDERITLIRQPNLEACFAQLATGSVEWVYTDEFSGRAAIAALDPTAGIELRERPVSITGYHLAIARNRAGANDLATSLDRALNSPAAAEATAALVADRLAKTGTLSQN